MPLRLKSPSRPWPTASCSSTPFQPAPSTTSISPAGQGTASRLTSAWRSASSTCSRHFSGVIQASNAGAPAGAGHAVLAPAVLLDGDLHVDAHQRPHVADQPPVGAQDLDDAPLAGQRGHHLGDARIAGAGEGVDLLQQGRPCRRSSAGRADRPRRRAWRWWRAGPRRRRRNSRAWPAPPTWRRGRSPPRRSRWRGRSRRSRRPPRAGRSLRWSRRRPTSAARRRRRTTPIPSAPGRARRRRPLRCASPSRSPARFGSTSADCSRDWPRMGAFMEIWLV